MDNMFMYNFDDEKNKIDSDIALKNKALEDIITSQQEEETKIRDDYDSLGSRAGRFLEVLGAGLSGGNAAQVAQNQRDNLNKQLQSAQSRYKDQRDSAYNQYKDLLARREALEKDKYQKERDQVRDSQFEKEFGLKEKQTNFAIGQGKQKENELLQSINDQQKLKAEEKAFIENDINNLLSNLNPKDILPTRDSEEISSARINDLNLKIAKNKYDKEGKDAVSFINENPNLFLNDKDSKTTLRGKLGILGYNLPEDKAVVDEQKKVDAEYIKKLDRISKDPNKTNKLLSKYNNDPKAAYRAWMNKPKIFDTLD